VTVPSITRDRLYRLLPSLYRIEDEKNGRPLEALLALINDQADALREDVRQLRDDLFIETCDRWVVPYIGDLVGNVPLHDVDVAAAARTAESLFTDLAGPNLAAVNPVPLRADVAGTIGYRRRKGTAAMLERLAADITGWSARVVEFFELLGWNQHLAHIRIDHPTYPNVRCAERNRRIGGPWDEAAHTVDVRAINEWDGWYGIRSLGIFLWRLKAMERTNVQARAIGGTTWRFTFSPLGQDVPIFSAGSGKAGGSGRTTELTVHDTIRPTALQTDLAALRTGQGGQTSDWYGHGAAARLLVKVGDETIPAADICCADLSGWTSMTRPDGNIVCIDVERGRLALGSGRDGSKAGSVLVTFCEGASGELGGGEYPRQKWLTRWVPSSRWVPVSGGADALEALLADPDRSKQPTVIAISDSLSYTLPDTITLKPGEQLSIEAKDGCRPHLVARDGQLTIDGPGSKASLTLNGLLFEGGIQVRRDMEKLRILHTTLVPGRSVLQEALARPTGPSLVVDPTRLVGAGGHRKINASLEVQIAFSILGPIHIPAHISRLWLLDSIVDGVDEAGAGKGGAVHDGMPLLGGSRSGPPAHIERSTILGSSWFRELEMASESIFTGPVSVDRSQQGCVRFSYVALQSKAPQQFHCQPRLEVATEAEAIMVAAAATGKILALNWEALLRARVGAWLVPSFEADDYGRPAYAQLRRTCPVEIRTGAEDGSEMGAYCLLKQPQVEANLRLRLDEYLPIGLEAGLITVT
jgi:hypothetical protein